jgi:formylglycine-generating enzyme required for sulfatase activity/dienelactone hydrolase/predicted Ser/Thr protein kinase
MPLQLPSRYQVGRELGRGGMGIVYEADDERLGRKVAVKVLHAGQASEERKRRFAQEARAASALNHPNIITIHDIDAHDGVDFIVMELVDGIALTRVSAGGALPLDRVLDYARQIAGALAASHAANIVHRDIKPANIMVTAAGDIKVLDFGLSKWTATAAEEALTAAPFTRIGTVVGTSGYMPPEQVLGQPIDARSDVFSFGVVLYELLAGRRAFDGDSDLAVTAAVMRDGPKPLSEIRSDLPEALRQIVDRCLEKDRMRRYPSGVEVLEDLRRLAPASAPGRPASTARYVAATSIVLLAAVIAGAWVAVRRWQTATMIERSIPEVERLAAGGQYVGAFRLAKRTTQAAPGDPRVRRALLAASTPFTMDEPAGADVYFKDYVDADGAWELLGRIPIKDARAPLGELRWRIAKDGFEAAEGSSVFAPSFTIHRSGETPAGMVYVRGGSSLEGTTQVQLPDFWIDKYEVTNREFKRFADAGGYSNRQYWKEPFVIDGVNRSFEDAIARFTDKTGRPGPATWELGTYREGQADYPVAGVSWYEASAYAEFAGKRLPTVFHWKQATGNYLFGQMVASSANFNGRSSEPPARLKDLGTYGTYGLAGNVKEWIWNETGGRRYVVGGAWNDPPYMALNREARSPVDRNETHGFRCVRDTSTLPPDALVAIAPRAGARTDKPVGDELYAAYRALYAYDRRPLDARVDSAEDSEQWRVEHVSIAAAYGQERVPVHILLPKNAVPPFQPVVWFPGGYAFGLFRFGNDIADAPGSPQFRFIPLSGRALVFPIYQGTFQRYGGVGEIPRDDQMNAYRDMVVQWSKDLGRTIDYLETRSDIDAGKLGYYSLSAGASAALPIVAVEPRFKAVVLVSGGLITARRPAEAEPLNFAAHITAPTLMISGRDDFIFPFETVAKPLFALLGAPPDRKHLVTHEGGHIPASNDLIREVLGWFDQYLGPVRTK